MIDDEIITSDSLAISGHPTDDEIAAIAAAYTFLLSQRGDKGVDKLSRQLMWNKAISRNANAKAALPSRTRTWVNVHRLLIRGNATN